MDRAQLLAARDEATTESLRQVVGDDDPAEMADLLTHAVEPADGTGRPLFTGLRARGRPVDPVQRRWWACDLVGEHRGDSHVAAVSVAGVGPVEMNVCAHLDHWGVRCIEAGAFPPDILKRAAG